MSRVAVNLLTWAILAFILGPILVILPMAFSDTEFLTFPPRGFTFRWFEEFFGSRRWMAALNFSLTIAVATAVLATLVGTMVSYALVRGAGRLGGVFQAILIGPIVVPHIALAVALYLFFRQTGLSGTLAGYVLAHTVIALPFVVFNVSAAISGVDPTLEDAAMSCGASRLTAFRTVTLPLITPNIVAGGLFAFIISFDEPVIAFFLSGIRDKTLPRMMFDFIETDLTPVVPAVAVLLTLLSVLVLVGGGLLRRLAQRTAAPKESD